MRTRPSRVRTPCWPDSAPGSSAFSCARKSCFQVRVPMKHVGTLRAVARYQQAHGLPVHGYPDVDTVRALGVSC